MICGCATIVVATLRSPINNVLFTFEEVTSWYLNYPFLFCIKCSQTIMWLIDILVNHAYAIIQLWLFLGNTNIKSLIK